MKFNRTLSSRATFKKQKYYEFPELTEEDIQEGRTRDYENRYFIVRNNEVFGIYFDTEKQALVITMYHSWDKFMEIKNG